ncbi:MAG: alpha/beta hydrolase-fold protein [Polyangiaceae bacterium]|jgi:poly(3-hydroxybutyrate) depolymerase
MGRLVGWVCVLWAIPLTDPCGSAHADDDVSADTSTPGVRLSTGPDGLMGAWLIAGPFSPAHVPFPPAELPRLGEAVGTASFGLAYAADGVVDLKASLKVRDGEWVAYAAAVLHVSHGGRHILLLGADDGVTVCVDGTTVFERDESRPQRDDDDLIGLELAPGDHRLLLTLHQHGGPWGLRVRWLDEGLEPPTDGWWSLPGAGGTELSALVAGLASVSLDRGLSAVDYTPRLRIRFLAGAPLDADIRVHARLRGQHDAEPLFDLDFGQAPRRGLGGIDFDVPLPAVAASTLEDGDSVLHLEVGGRSLYFTITARRTVRESLARATAALSRVGTAVLGPGTADSVEFLRNRLAAFVSSGDVDAEADERDARELDSLSAALEDERDPYDGKTGAMRRAYRSPADGQLSEFGLYAPPGMDKGRRLPLIVALHGMNGRPMQMLSWLFGHDDGHDSAWQERHPYTNLQQIDALVVAPDGHGNAGYRELGEDDVLRVIDWAERVYPVDDSRVTITGPSMGGIGTAACALRHPDRFAAAAPLCGYHSYFLRGDMAGRPLKPWERFLAEERSNVFWAENGSSLPLFIVHGTLDLPLENSSILADRYDELHYDEVHDYPDLGHNVWQSTYADLQGAKWLLDHKRPAHPRGVRFKTSNARWADADWVHVVALAGSAVWGEIDARIEPANVIVVVARGIREMRFDRDARWIDDGRPVAIRVDGTRLVFQAGEPIAMHLDADGWHPGMLGGALVKRGTINGPIRDAFHEPLLFVWGDDDPTQARANREVARAWSRVRSGVRADFPVMSDREFFARGELIANDRSLFLVGNARSNRIVRELEPQFPIRVDRSDVVLVRQGSDANAPVLERLVSASSPTWASQLGSMFIVPNPARPSRYAVVVEGVSALGTWRSLSLPELLPDYVVFDEAVAPARGGSVLGAAKLRAGGYFANDWQLPAL